MQIYNKDGSLLLDIEVDDNSYRSRAIMGDNTIVLYFSTAIYTEIPVGAYCVFEDETYTLMRPQALKMNHSRSFEYTVTMESAQVNAQYWKFRNPVDKRLKFPLTAKPNEHLQMFVDNMNSREDSDKWVVGDCVEGTETLINYDHAYCWEALKQMSDTFNTEFEIDGHTVSLGKVERNTDAPLALSYGKGNGFKSGVGRTNYNENPPVERLYIQGGSDNIDRSVYGSSELHLPQGGTIAYDGTYFEDESGFNSDIARTYEADELGMSIARMGAVKSIGAEDSLDCSSVYPKRVGTATSVVCVDAEKNLYDFIDDTIPDTLNYEDYLIAGETMTVIFQSGMLAGREFDVKYIHNPKGSKAGKRFEIVPQEEDGEWMPNETFKPNADGTQDTYAIFHVMLPEAYINAHKTDTDPKEGAEWDMMREAVKYLYENEEQNFTFTGTLDGIWAKKNWSNIQSKIVLGGAVLFSDERFQQEGVSVRIISIKDYINTPHSPEIELSNSTVSSSFSNSIKTLESQEVQIEENYNNAISFAKRRYRDAKETMDALALAIEGFSEGVKPITVQTMAMLVGEEGLQFRFVNSPTDLTETICPVVWSNSGRYLNCPVAYLQHMTIGISDISATHANSEYRVWELESERFGFEELTTGATYLYAQVPVIGSVGSWVWSTTPLQFETSTSYNLLVGILSDLSEDEASFTTVYGFTEVLPGRITTDRIVSTNGQTYFDLVKGEIGGVIKFLSENNEYETLVDGGKIKSEFIDVSSLTADGISVGDPDGKHVEIIPDDATLEGKVSVYDEGANESVILEGNQYTSQSELFGDGESGTITMKTRTQDEYGYASGTSLGKGVDSLTGDASTTSAHKIVLSEPFYSYVPTEITINAGYIKTAASATGNENEAMALARVYVETYAEETLATLKGMASVSYTKTSVTSGGATKTDGKVATLNGKSVRVGSGYHVITLYTTMTATSEDCTASVTWQHSSAGGVMSAGYDTTFFIARYFANGFCIGESLSKYLSVLHRNNALYFSYQSGQLGFRLTPNGVSVVYNGGANILQPIMVYKANYYYESDAYTTKGTVWSIAGGTLEATRVSRGVVNLSVPTSWTTIMGEVSRDNLTAIVNGYNDTTDARVYDITRTAIDIRLSDDSSKNDGDFGITIFLHP